MPCWYFSKAFLRDSPSLRDSIDAPTQARYRREGTRFIMEAGDKLDLHYETCATAVVFFHRFYVLQSFKSYHRFVTATSCLLLAMKIEKRSVVGVAQTLVGSEGILSTEQLKVFGDDCLETIISAERAILETLKFDVIVTHPYSYLIKLIRQIKGDPSAIEQLLQMAWTFINDGLSVPLCVEWEPDLLALAYVYLAARLTKFSITDWDGRPADFVGKWYIGLMPDSNINIIKDICEQIVELYSGGPTTSDPPAVTEQQKPLSDKTARTTPPSAVATDRRKSPDRGKSPYRRKSPVSRNSPDRGKSPKRSKKRSQDSPKKSSERASSKKKNRRRSASREKPIRLRSPLSTSSRRNRKSNSVERKKLGDADRRTFSERCRRSANSPASRANSRRQSANSPASRADSRRRSGVSPASRADSRRRLSVSPASRADSRRRSAVSPARRTNAAKRKRSESPLTRFRRLRSPSQNIPGRRSFSPGENRGFRSREGSAMVGRRMGFSPVSTGNMSNGDGRGERGEGKGLRRSASLERWNVGGRRGEDYRSTSRGCNRDGRFSPLHDPGRPLSREEMFNVPYGRFRDFPPPPIPNPFSSAPPPLNPLAPLSRDAFERLQAELRVKSQPPFGHPESLPPLHALPGYHSNPPDYSGSRPPLIGSLYPSSHPFGQAPGGPPVATQCPPPLLHPYVVQTPQGFIVRAPPPGVPSFPTGPPPAVGMEIPPPGYPIGNQLGLQSQMGQQIPGAWFFSSGGGYTIQGVEQNVRAPFIKGILGQPRFIPGGFPLMPPAIANPTSIGHSGSLVGQPPLYIGAPPVSIPGIGTAPFVGPEENFCVVPAQHLGPLVGGGIPPRHSSPSVGVQLAAPPRFTPPTRQNLAPPRNVWRSHLIEPAIVSVASNAVAAASHVASTNPAPGSQELVRLRGQIAPDKPKPVTNVCTSNLAAPKAPLSGGSISSDSDAEGGENGGGSKKADGEENSVVGGENEKAGADGENNREGGSGRDAKEPIVVGDKTGTAVAKAPSFISLVANKERSSSANFNRNRFVSELAGEKPFNGKGRGNPATIKEGVLTAETSWKTFGKTFGGGMKQSVVLASSVLLSGTLGGSARLQGPYQGMRCLIIGHTFVLQLHEAKMNFDLGGAEVVIDGLAAATVDQVTDRIFSMDKLHLQFDVVFIDIGSFDLLDPAKTPQYVVSKIMDVSKYLRVECRVARVFVNHLVNLRVPEKAEKRVYVQALGHANNELALLTRELPGVTFWVGPTPRIGIDLTLSDAIGGLKNYFESVRTALRQGVEDVSVARR